MRRSRGRDLSLGVAAVLANVLLVLGVVALATGRGTGPEQAPPTSAGAATATPATTSSTSSPTPTTTTRPLSALLGSGEDVTVAVLGDGTGDEEGEWVSAFADLAGKTHQVTVQGLDPQDPTQYTSKRRYGSDGPRVTVWNGSRSGASAAYPAPRLGFLVPAEPDAVILNFGRDDTVTHVAADLEKTYRALRARWPDVPVAVTVQPPDRDDVIGPVRAVATEWAESHDLPLIDAASAFSDAGDPNDFVSTVDPPSVNAEGGRLWGRAAFRALGGSAA